MKIAENYMTNKIIRYFKAESKVPNKGTLFAYLTISIILLYAVNNLRYIGITQLDEKKLVSCMWSANIALGIAVIGNFSLMLKRPIWLYFLVQMLIDASAIISVFFVYRLYPFIFSNAVVNDAIRASLILIAACLFAAFLVEFYRFGINVHWPKKKTVIDLGQSCAASISEGETVLPQNMDTNNATGVESTSLTTQKNSDEASKPSIPTDSTPSLTISSPEGKTVLSRNPNEINPSANQSVSPTTPEESNKASKPTPPPNLPHLKVS
jgi:hypothetical protein